MAGKGEADLELKAILELAVQDAQLAARLDDYPPELPTAKDLRLVARDVSLAAQADLKTVGRWKGIKTDSDFAKAIGRWLKIGVESGRSREWLAEEPDFAEQTWILFSYYFLASSVEHPSPESFMQLLRGVTMNVGPYRGNGQLYLRLTTGIRPDWSKPPTARSTADDQAEGASSEDGDQTDQAQ